MSLRQVARSSAEAAVSAREYSASKSARVVTAPTGPYRLFAAEKLSMCSCLSISFSGDFQAYALAYALASAQLAPHDRFTSKPTLSSAAPCIASRVTFAATSSSSGGTSRRTSS